MKKTLGYGYKLGGESLKEAMSNYPAYYDTLKEVVSSIRYDKKEGIISKAAKPKIFKVIVEIL